MHGDLITMLVAFVLPPGAIFILALSVWIKERFGL